MSSEPVYLANARLIDGTGQLPFAEPYAVLVSGARIQAVAPQSQLPCPEGVVRFDLGGKTLMPGLIDCHDHLADIPGGMVVRAAIPPSLAVMMAAQTCTDTLLGGFTAIRDAGGLDLGIKMAVDHGLIPGPRLVISVGILMQTGGQGDHTEPAGIDSWFPRLPGVPDGMCDGPAECRRKVREMVRAGADWIKICTTGGVSTPTGGPLIRQFSLEEVQAMVDAAHAAGKPVMSHAYGGEGVRICLEAGVDCIEHGAALDDDMIEMMVRQGTWLVPTFTVLRNIIAIGRLQPCPLPAYAPRKAQALLDYQAVSFRKALLAGVRMAMGTDGGAYGHGRNAVELAYLVEAGMTPLQAITAATGMAAQLLGLAEETGSLREGRCADLLVVDRDPLQDVSILEDRSHLRLIMRDGVQIKNTL